MLYLLICLKVIPVSVAVWPISICQVSRFVLDITKDRKSKETRKKTYRWDEGERGVWGYK